MICSCCAFVPFHVHSRKKLTGVAAIVTTHSSSAWAPSLHPLNLSVPLPWPCCAELKMEPSITLVLQVASTEIPRILLDNLTVGAFAVMVSASASAIFAPL